jgi:hypothetical protein
MKNKHPIEKIRAATGTRKHPANSNSPSTSDDTVGCIVCLCLGWIELSCRSKISVLSRATPELEITNSAMLISETGRSSDTNTLRHMIPLPRCAIDRHSWKCCSRPSKLLAREYQALSSTWISIISSSLTIHLVMPPETWSSSRSRRC